MPDIRVISYAEHANKRWFKPTEFGFTRKDRIAAIGLSEIPKAMLSLPLGFAQVEGGYIPVAVQGFLKEQNLLVSPNGQWLADYIPLVYRSYPFKLARNSDGQFVLCVDHDSGLITEAPAGYPFFSEENKLAPEISALASQLMVLEAERVRAIQACKLLVGHGIIEPWPIQINNENKLETVEGLYRINESKLNEVAAEVLLEIRNSSALMLCYAQLFSVQHLQQLGIVAQRTHWANRTTDITNKVAPLNIVDDNGIVSFANL